MYEACLEEVRELKEEVRRMLATNANEFLKKLKLIDSLQRLGVGYHFEGELEEMLEQIHDAPCGFDGNDLYTVALWFRLLRQQGYNVPCDVFNRFKDSDGNFKEDLIKDVSSMLCLYEATHLRIPGEDILDEALEFTTTGLKSIVTDLKPPLATQVMHALRQPLHKGVSRIEARHYISIYQEDKTKNEILLKLAKRDFNLLQSIYLQELRQLSKWWKELNFASKLPYGRERLVECYFWIIGLYFEPHYALAREISTKILVMISIIDDTYDAYGGNLAPWMDSPEYMKVVYIGLLDVYNEIEEELRKKGQSYCVNYAKEANKALVRAYLTEAKWFNDGYIPTFKEYMQNGLISSAVTMFTVGSLLGMGDVVTKKAFDWAMDEPKILKVLCMHGRLMNDMKSHKFEQERGHVCSAVECYVKEYDASEQEAYDEFNGRVKDGWKDINQAFMKPIAVPMPVLLLYVNFARTLYLIYKDTDGYTFAHEVLKEFITSMFIDPI
ncbi:hypothetical protein NE237_014925 [Protea cynaroides]|uniref:Uncharacterized protein n=1 Tax=Protea cynaroides TaxID=273540 RepID=A0A9Q0KD25_9MAGN|nr:hypothetical protein NE237_014925 [Protea cynaroides]